ncbi:hypothetical protein [Klebsiella pneumoniae]|uniref:hypothetical protein n=1 Tax=Klebsiella pneumoniae TaxID=573 RepID=UPI0030EE7535
MTTDITELALMKGQKVEAPYYLAECTECGKMYSSSKLIESRNYFDGDADCYCPHCNADDADIADLGSSEKSAVMAWNYQQARIDVLVEALEKAQQRIAELEQKHCGGALMERELAHSQVIKKLMSEIDNRDFRIAELESRSVKLSPELYTIGDLIRTQDNRITDQPMFVVFQKREIIGSDEHSPSRICWVWDGEEVSELRAKRLEALYQDGRDTRGYDRYAMQEVDEFVTACFTEHGCKDYLRQNGHNLRLPYIYACGSFRNNEYQLVRNWLAGIKVEAE